MSQDMESDQSNETKPRKSQRKFTASELIAIVFIIMVPAVLLLPAIKIGPTRPPGTVAKSNIATLGQALTTYNLSFGAFPLDSNDALVSSEPNFKNMDSPNECMVWFLTRDFSTDASIAEGVPWAKGSGWDPSTAERVYSRISHRNSLDVRAKQLRDDDGDGFYEFVDGWGRPYFYRAYPKKWPIARITKEAANTFRYTFADAETPAPVPNIGKVQIDNCTHPGNNGIFNIALTGDNWFDIVNPAGKAEMNSPGVVSFPLHNSRTFDLYSLGRNGRTRAATQPEGKKGWDAAADPDGWKLLWGTPGDGNDVPVDETGNIGIKEKDQDDINNWSR